MISEVVNALFITYVATEYNLASSHLNHGSSSPWWNSRANLGAIVVVIIINIIDRISGAADLANEVFQGILHAPKILFCALAYLGALYVDCRRVISSLSLKTFGRHVGAAFCRVAPAYPILAVMISFVFMFVISLFEHLHLPLEWLNWPIYYGTLYGPFSVMYWHVKRRVVQDYYSLPTRNVAGNQKGPSKLPPSNNDAAGEKNPGLAAAIKRRQQTFRR